MSDNGPDTPPISHKWQPIEDLPENWRDLCRPDLHAVHRQWVADRKLHQRSKEACMNFQERRLYALWAIETGHRTAIQGRSWGHVQLFLKRAWSPRDSSRASFLPCRSHVADQREALTWSWTSSGPKSRVDGLRTSRNCTKRLTSHQDDTRSGGSVRQYRDRVPVRKGRVEEMPNNRRQPDGTIHSTAHRSRSKARWIGCSLGMKSTSRDVCPEVEAAWLHHRFTQIHPFEDGNGRVARCSHQRSLPQG